MRCGQVSAELNVVGGGELCNEGMLRKQGPAGSLTTYIVVFSEPIKFPSSVGIVGDMHENSYRSGFGIVIWNVVVRDSSSLIVHL